MDWEIPSFGRYLPFRSPGASETMWNPRLILKDIHGRMNWVGGLRQMVGASLILGLFFSMASGQSNSMDLIEEFRKELAKELWNDPAEKEKEEKTRLANLKSLIEKCHSLGDKSQMLLLSNWNFARKTDSDLREDLLKSFKSDLIKALEDPDPAIVTAACFVIQQCFFKAEKSQTQMLDIKKELKDLEEELVKQSSREDSDIKAAVILTLGKIKAPVDVFYKVVNPMVSASQPVHLRRAAFDAIKFYINDLFNDNTAVTSADPTRDSLKDFYGSDKIIRLLGATPGIGVTDSVGLIQLRAAEALEVLSMIPINSRKIIEDPVKLSEQNNLEKTRQDGLQQIKKYMDLLSAYRNIEKNLATGVLSANPEIQGRLIRAIENITVSRTKLRRFNASLPSPAPEVLPVPPNEDQNPKKGKSKEVNQNLNQPIGLVAFSLVQDKENPKDIDPSLLLENGVLLQALAAILKGPFPIDNRLLALSGIESGGSQGIQVESALIGTLCDPNNFIRWGSVRTLGRLEEKLGDKLGDASIRGMIPLLRDEDVAIRVAVCLALEKFANRAEMAIEPLTEIVSSGDPEVRISAMKTLVAIGPKAACSVLEIAKNLTDTNKSVRGQAAWSLGRFGPQAIQTASAIRALVADVDNEVAKNASDALIRILGR